jgi:hypothetical protein
MFLFRSSAATEAKPPPPRPAAQTEAAEYLPDEAPSASAKTREQKRFDRVDKDKSDSITRDEYFALRRKAFAKLDTNGDGRLSFEEWGAKGIARFTGADSDKSGTLTRAEFATTAVKRKAPARPRCDCKTAPKAVAAPEEGDAGE